MNHTSLFVACVLIGFMLAGNFPSVQMNDFSDEEKCINELAAEMRKGSQPFIKNLVQASRQLNGRMRDIFYSNFPQGHYLATVDKYAQPEQCNTLLHHFQVVTEQSSCFEQFYKADSDILLKIAKLDDDVTEAVYICGYLRRFRCIKEVATGLKKESQPFIEKLVKISRRNGGRLEDMLDGEFPQKFYLAAVERYAGPRDCGPLISHFPKVFEQFSCVIVYYKDYKSFLLKVAEDDGDVIEAFHICQYVKLSEKLPLTFKRI